MKTKVFSAYWLVLLFSQPLTATERIRSLVTSVTNFVTHHVYRPAITRNDIVPKTIDDMNFDDLDIVVKFSTENEQAMARCTNSDEKQDFILKNFAINPLCWGMFFSQDKLIDTILKKKVCYFAIQKKLKNFVPLKVLEKRGECDHAIFLESNQYVLYANNNRTYLFDLKCNQTSKVGQGYPITLCDRESRLITYDPENWKCYMYSIKDLKLMSVIEHVNAPPKVYADGSYCALNIDKQLTFHFFVKRKGIDQNDFFSAIIKNQVIKNNSIKHYNISHDGRYLLLNVTTLKNKTSCCIYDLLRSSIPIKIFYDSRGQMNQFNNHLVVVCPD